MIPSPLQTNLLSGGEHLPIQGPPLLAPVIIGVPVVEPHQDGLIDGHRLHIDERSPQGDQDHLLVGLGRRRRPVRVERVTQT